MRYKYLLVNFLTNALRYSADNGKVILTCQRHDSNVVFTIQDFGPGIERKYVDRLFEKFFQVPGSKPGTGLGLAISKEFIDAQGGSIGVTSEVGRGSVFTFSLNVIGT